MTTAHETDRLTDINDLLRRVSALEDPQEVQKAFGESLGRINRVDGYLAASRRGLEPGAYKITREMLDGEFYNGNTTNPWKQWDSLPMHRGGFVGDVLREDVPRRFDNLELPADPVLGDRLGPFRSAIAVPLYDQGEALNWAFMLRRAPNAWTDDEFEDFMLRGNLIGRMTRNLVIQREVKALNHQLAAQLDEIARIQRALLPERLPRIPGLELAASYLTSEQAGGDYYDFFELPGGRWGLLIADVSGHGAGAATVVAMLNAIVHGYPHDEWEPAAIMAYANRQLSAKRIETNFVTAFLSVWDPATRSMTYTNAGHHPPAVRRRDGSIDFLRGGYDVPLDVPHDVPLGVLDDVAYHQSDATLEPGQTVIYFTDGVLEAFGPPPEREMFGLERLTGSLLDCSGAPACVIDSIHEGLFAHTGLRTRGDDQTIVVARVTERSAATPAGAAG